LRYGPFYGAKIYIAYQVISGLTHGELPSLSTVTLLKMTLPINRLSMHWNLRRRQDFHFFAFLRRRKSQATAYLNVLWQILYLSLKLKSKSIHI